jgi:hypothetical protein
VVPVEAVTGGQSMPLIVNGQGQTDGQMTVN